MRCFKPKYIFIIIIIICFVFFSFRIQVYSLIIKMSSQLVGTWDFESSENWEEFMKEMGVGFLLRKAAAAIKPTVHIANNGTHWSLKLNSTLKNVETEADENVEFKESN
jgi:hypothetical protein